jgi:hypothetical protein
VISVLERKELTQDFIGAPECVVGRYRKGTTDQTQEIDTWSFGCVLSAIATWVIFGSRAYLGYEQVRKLAVRQLKEDTRDPRAMLPIADDAFHDGRNVLPAVLDWHQYLRNCCRKSDTLTVSVLDLVEKRMLQANPKARLPSAKLDIELQKLLRQARTNYKSMLDLNEIPSVPDNTLRALLTLDSFTPPEGKVVVDSDVPLGRFLISQDRKTHTKTTRVNKTERLESVIPARVANRQEALNRELLERGVGVDPLGIVFGSPESTPMRPERATTPRERDISPIRLPDGRSRRTTSPRQTPMDQHACRGVSSGVTDPIPISGHEDSAKILMGAAGSPTVAHYASGSSLRPVALSARQHAESNRLGRSSPEIRPGEGSGVPCDSVLDQGVSRSPSTYTHRQPTLGQLSAPSPIQRSARNTTEGSSDSHRQPNPERSTPRIVNSQLQGDGEFSTGPLPTEAAPSLTPRRSKFVDSSGYRSLPIGQLFQKLDTAWQAEQSS